MRTLLLVGAAAFLTFSVTPIPAKSDPPTKVEPSAEQKLLARVSDLEGRVARIERQLAAPTSDLIPFGEVTVNLKEERLTRYLRVKLSIQVDETDYRILEARVEKKKTELKNAAITFLTDRTLADVRHTQGVRGVSDGLKKAFGEVLAPGAKSNPIKDILFDEYLIQ
ncbi:flagellar basal body-associated FliL family protein [Limnoglobus roseus]|uniref:Flagellar protein FliL n=1 Tax=Limnoglobus roseus TaxID=2598579 RepID=A0A5C1AR60_9BACT|nr:flagellar basal body-associated FliL family protein [Limnoglobus roseus]QEL19378.1 hypothetical protein PX52LOC_06449 [Limnoglobus roseus]